MRKNEELIISFDEDTDSAVGKGKVWRFIYEWLESVVYAMIFILIAFTFLFRIVGVEGDSMNPNLFDGDWLTVNAINPKIERGDIVVITQPNSLNEPLVKRVIAVGGDEIYIDFNDGTVKINGIVQVEPYILDETNLMGDWVYPVNVPKGKVFVMGDNRNNSTDSRFRAIGLIDERYILGKVHTRLYPDFVWSFDSEKKQ
ncbi:MAG: signal peptidase I [Clostridiales bacterium]|nr:signal peptidase I [Clostridiales bacterium]